MNNSFLIILAVVLYGCAGPNEIVKDAMPLYGDLLRFEIETDTLVETNQTGIIIKLEFFNTSEDSIKIFAPECLGLVTDPHFVNSNGDTLPIMARINIECPNYKPIFIKPKEVLITDFILNLDEAYDLSIPGKYRLQIDYNGGLFVFGGTEYVGSLRLKSNTLWITVQE